MQDRDPRIGDHYDAIADRWDEIVETARGDSLWSSLEALLPDLEGKRVLDAGCGSGVYTSRLLDRGGDVIGVEISEAMLREARDRVPEATFRRADLSESLDCLGDGSVDVVLCQHVFSHLENLAVPLEEFARVLVDDGFLVVSTHNPVYDYLVVRDERQPTTGDRVDLEKTVHTAPGAPSYTETERFDVTYGTGSAANRGTYYRRSFEDLFSPVLAAGFDLQNVVEPTEAESSTENGGNVRGEEDYPPETICFRARR